MKRGKYSASSFCWAFPHRNCLSAWRWGHDCEIEAAPLLFFLMFLTLFHFHFYSLLQHPQGLDIAVKTAKWVSIINLWYSFAHNYPPKLSIWAEPGLIVQGKTELIAALGKLYDCMTIQIHLRKISPHKIPALMLNTLQQSSVVCKVVSGCLWSSETMRQQADYKSWTNKPTIDLMKMGWNLG